MGRKILVLVFLSFIMAFSVFAQNSRTMKKDFFGCDTKENYNRALSMMIDKDFEALSRLLLAGKCILLNEGDTVYLENVTLTGFAKVRPKGKSTVWWTDLNQLSK